jgi:hypothetical protein
MGADEMRRLQAMRDAGMDTRRLQQTAYDMQKAEFEKEMQHPERQLKFMTGMLQQLPYQNITQQAMYTPQAGPMTTMLDAAGQDIENLANYQAQQQAANVPAPAPVAGPTGPTDAKSAAAAPVQQTTGNAFQGVTIDPSQMNQTAQNMFGTNITVPAQTNYGGGIIGMRNSQIASRLGGGMIPMYYGG